MDPNRSMMGPVAHYWPTGHACYLIVFISTARTTQGRKGQEPSRAKRALAETKSQQIYGLSRSRMREYRAISVTYGDCHPFKV